MKRNMKTLLVVVLIASLVACAVPTTGVIPRGDGLYTVTRQGGGAWVTTDQLKAQGLTEAANYCESKKKNLKLVHSKEIPAGPFGRWPESEVLFRCE
jgi:hypothetical protein